MKTRGCVWFLLLIASLCLVLVAVGCKDAGVAPTGDYINVPGTIVEEFPHFFLIKPDAASGVSILGFYPLNLPKNLEINGLQIIFSGSIETPWLDEMLYPKIRLSYVGIRTY